MRRIIVKKLTALITILAILVLCSAPTAAAMPADIRSITATPVDSGEGGYIEYIYIDENGNIIERDTSLSFEPTFGTMSDGTVIPSSYDARTNNVVTPVKSQGRAGNCWAFSAVSALESATISMGESALGSTDFSESHLAWFGVNTATTDTSDLAYGDGTSGLNPYQTGGNWLMVSQALSRWAGIAKQDADPLAYNDISTLPQYTDAQRRNTDSGFIIKDIKEFLSADEVKKHILEYGSVTASYYTDDLYYTQASGSTAYYNSSATTTNHAITVVGWDDNYSSSNFKSGYRPTQDGAWLCKNSWDTWWGDSGYFWLSYSDVSAGGFVGYIPRSAEDFYGNYNYNGDYCRYWFGYSKSTSVANIFTAKDNEKIKSVSTYTNIDSAGTQVNMTFDIYTDVSESGGPCKGTLEESFNVTVGTSGYHTFDLSDAVAVKPGSRFSVVMTIKGCLAPFEHGDGYSSNGESYISDGNRWHTTETFYSGQYDLNNVFLQAQTVCDHQPQTQTGETSCTQDGFEKTVCTQCGRVLSESIIPSDGHSFGAWETAIEPTISQAGKRIRICADCGETESEIIPAIEYMLADGFAIDTDNGIISGINPGEVSLEKYIMITNPDYQWSYETDDGKLGTGARAILKNGDTAIGEFTILLYGDIDGNAWYDGQDAVLASCVAGEMLTQESLGMVAYMAADCNHDGVVDEMDVALLNEAGLLLATVDQSKATGVLLETSSAYSEYLDLITQTPVTQEPEEETVTGTEDLTVTAYADILAFLRDWIARLIEFFLTFIPRPY